MIGLQEVKSAKLSHLPGSLGRYAVVPSTAPSLVSILLKSNKQYRRGPGSIEQSGQCPTRISQYSHSLVVPVANIASIPQQKSSSRNPAEDINRRSRGCPSQIQNTSQGRHIASSFPFLTYFFHSLRHFPLPL